MAAGRVILKSGRDRPVRGGNPWIFSQALQRIEPAGLAPGELVEVHDSSNALIGLGYHHPATTIAVRMLAWGESPPLAELIAARIRRAIDIRRRVVTGETDCYRLINGDGDGLAGVVVDRYGDVLVIQLLTAGADRMRAELVTQLQAVLAPRAIIERSQGAVRRQEGLEDRTVPLTGDPVTEAVVTENGIRLCIDFEAGQKTGYFLDQRDNRARFGALARDATVLDLCCYGGGFALAALAGGARRVVAVDTSARALAGARHNAYLNGHAADAIEFIHADAARYLAETSDQFDLLMLDPPPLARSRADADRAAHRYVQLNAKALRAVARGGQFFSFSCSVHFRGEDFVHAVRIAQSKAARNFRLLANLGAGPDHPTLLGHIEGEYLTGVWLADLE